MRYPDFRFDDEMRRAFEAFLRRLARGRSAASAGLSGLAALFARLLPGPVGRGAGTLLSLVFGGLFAGKRPDVPPEEPLDPFTLTGGEPEFPFGRFIGGRGIAGIGGTLARELEILDRRGF
jgi:hypothetical protein